jgi:hypothetical protein
MLEKDVRSEKVAELAEARGRRTRKTAARGIHASDVTAAVNGALRRSRSHDALATARISPKDAVKKSRMEVGDELSADESGEKSPRVARRLEVAREAARGSGCKREKSLQNGGVTAD